MCCIGQRPLAIDDKPAWVVLNPAAPAHTFPGNTVQGGGAAGGIRQSRGKDESLLLGKRILERREKQVFLLEYLGAVKIHREHDQCFGPQLRDLVLFETQLRLLMHSATSPVECSEID